LKLKLHWQILIAIVLAAGAGWAAGAEGGIFGLRFYDVFDFVGTLFINALKMLIVPLIASSIIVGVANIGSSKHLGSIGRRTLGFYVLTTLASVLVGLLVLNIIQPGIVDGRAAGT
jgi:proton glutamate symport protein